MTNNNEGIKLNPVETTDVNTDNTTFNATVETADVNNTDNVEVFQSTVTGAMETADVNTENDTDNDTAIIPTANSTTGAITVTLDACIEIFKAGDKMQKRGMAIKMVALAIIDAGKLYEEKGYTSVLDMAEKEFDLNPQTTRSYLQTCKKFYNVKQFVDSVKLDDLVDTDGNFKKAKDLTITSIFADGDNDFSPSALESMRSIDVDTVQTLLQEHTINYDMSSTALKKILKDYRKKSRVEVTDDTDGAITIDTTDDTTDVNVENISEIDNPNPATDVDEKLGCNPNPAKQASVKSTPIDAEYIAAIEADNDRLVKENDSLKAEINRLMATIEDLQIRTKRAENLSETHAKHELQVLRQNETLQAENTALANENQRLTENAMTQAAQIESLQADNISLKNSNNSYKAANSKAKKVNDTLKAENATLKAENDTLKSATADDTEKSSTADDTPVTVTAYTADDTDNTDDTNNADNTDDTTIA